MLHLRPNRERRDADSADLPPQSTLPRICTFECIFYAL
jgi:hypothetical protein